MKKSIFMIFSLCTLLFSGEYNPLKGKMLALSCGSCHGTDGKSTSLMPSIGGLDKETLYETLLAYKYGKKKGTMMAKHTKGFTDKELEQVSYYFSKIKE